MFLLLNHVPLSGWTELSLRLLGRLGCFQGSPLELALAERGRGQARNHCVTVVSCLAHIPAASGGPVGARGLAGLVLPSRRLCPMEGRPERWEREVSSSPGQHPASSPSAEAGGHGLPWVCRSGRDQNVFRDADSDSPRRRVAVLAHRVAKVGQATMETFLARADRNLLMIVRIVTIFTAFPIGPWHSAQK